MSSSLRERKKQETRRHIAAVAARLFAERGFDAVTVDEIAQAADVSRKTVFNYFPTKEDLALDRAEDREAELVNLVRSRPPGVTLMRAFREDTLRSIRAVAESGGRLPDGGLLGLARSSPTLWRRALDVHARHEHILAKEIAELAGLPEWDPVARTVAHVLLGAKRSVRWECQRRLDAGEPPADVVKAVERDVYRIFDLLERGLGSYETGPRHDREASPGAPGGIGS